MASMVSPKTSGVEREGESVLSPNLPPTLPQRKGLNFFYKGVDGGNLLC